MLFNSYDFIFLFLPVVVAGTFVIARWSRTAAALWLGCASLYFYGVWNPLHVPLLLASIGFNYGCGRLIGTARQAEPARARKVLSLAILANLALLGIFKYTNFFVETINVTLQAQVPALDIVMPLGISFFTFTQIAFLVDVYKGQAREVSAVHYLLFVTYFPHLIAGPVLHHAQMMPQFRAPSTYRPHIRNIAVGLTIFVLGLAKKVLIADNLATIASPIFAAAAKGAVLTGIEAWMGALAYTLQLYFDFSGYSDMAIGLSLCLNVRLPLNFDSPYKSASIIDFWRRWHITLSVFLRDYLYIPLGGGRHGTTRRYGNLMATMLLGGLWHGAGWTFVVWGGLHGIYLVLNHGWRSLKQRAGIGDGGKAIQLVSIGLTFMAVVIGWVFFRAESFTAAGTMLAGMAGFHGLGLETALPATQLVTASSAMKIAAGLMLVFCFPNVREIFAQDAPTVEDLTAPRTTIDTNRLPLRWQPSTVTALGYSLLFVLCLFNMERVSEFLYFQF